MPPPADWAQEVAFTVATQVRTLRGKVSTQKLSERTKELGYEVTRSVLSDLENGRRRHITVPELIVLARALNTTPLALLYPDPVNGDDIDMLPAIRTTQAVALQWFSALVDSPSLLGDVVCDDRDAYAKNTKPIELARQIWELDGQRAALMKAREELTGAEKREYLLAMSELSRQIDKLKGADDGR